MVRVPCGEDTSELTKGPWSKEEDEKLTDYIRKHGHENWRALPKRAGLNRCGKSCRLRWINYLKPNIKRGDFSHEEEQLIFKLHSQFGNKWSRIATHLQGRTDNEIKNYWNTRMKKKLIRNGIDPLNHQSLLNPNLLANLSLLNLMAYPNLNNPFNPTNNLQVPENLIVQMLNQKAFDPSNFQLRNAFDPIIQLQLSQSLMPIINPNPFLNVINPLGEINYPQQDTFHDSNNMAKNPQNFNPQAGVSIPKTSSECEFQPKISNVCYNNFNTEFISEIEISLADLVSVETPGIVNEVESNMSPMTFPSRIMFEDWDNFWDDEADVIQWSENML